MKKIKTLFRSLSLSTEYDKILLKLSASDDFLRPTDDMTSTHINIFQILCMKIEIRDAIDGHDTEINQQKAISEFFGQFKMYDNWYQSLKTLYILHKLVHQMKLNITHVILENDIGSELKSNLRIQNQGEEVHVPIALKYYQYLKQISKHYQYYYECEQFSFSENLDYLKAKKTTDIIDSINPLISILKNIFKATQNLSFSMQNFPKYEITKCVGLMIIKDSIMIYDFISCVMSIIKDKILTEQKSTSLMIYEAYEEVVILTKTIEKLHELRNFTIDPYIKKPKYFKVEKENNRQIELHINQIHKQINNTDNVTATVSKSVNESSIQQDQFQQQPNGQHNVQNGAGQAKYLAVPAHNQKNKQDKLKLKESLSKEHLINKNMQTELVNLNQRSEIEDGDFEERLNLSSTKAQNISGHNMSGGYQFGLDNSRENSDDQNIIKEDQYYQNNIDEIFDDESTENQRIYVNTLCTKNDKIQPLVKKEKKSPLSDLNQSPNLIQEQNKNGQVLQRGLSESNSVINLVFENQQNIADEDGYQNYKNQNAKYT